jgi:plasmid stabilization system protein ParE
MTYPVEITPFAIADAELAYLWLRERSPEAAAAWYNGLFDAIDSLEKMPYRCPLSPESEELNIELRQLLYGKRGQQYRILYTIEIDERSGEEVVRVQRIRHQAQDALKTILEHSEDQSELQ